MYSLNNKIQSPMYKYGGEVLIQATSAAKIRRRKLPPLKFSLPLSWIWYNIIRSNVVCVSKCVCVCACVCVWLRASKYKYTRYYWSGINPISSPTKFVSFCSRFRVEIIYIHINIYKTQPKTKKKTKNKIIHLKTVNRFRAFYSICIMLVYVCWCCIIIHELYSVHIILWFYFILLLANVNTRANGLLLPISRQLTYLVKNFQFTKRKKKSNLILFSFYVLLSFFHIFSL